MIDIVIPLGSGSRFNDIELMYALRGVEKYLSGVGNVFIIGPRIPRRITGVIHVEYDDSPESRHKEANIFLKIAAACIDFRVSDTFLFMNDDHYMLSQFNAEEFPVHHKGDLKGNALNRNEHDPYGITLRNTLAVVGDQAMNYDTHCPILFNKERFLRSVGTVCWLKPFGYGVKTLYCCMNGINGEYYQDCKTDSPLTIPEGRLYFSSHKGSSQMWRYLDAIFPNKSKYEI